ncbi:hypothetical protein DRQ26_00845 [bacterium]|nr:MAG: hypothetical protein DRQ26_00845 [bacterium]
MKIFVNKKAGTSILSLIVLSTIFIMSGVGNCVPNRMTTSMQSGAPASNSIGDIVFDGNCIWVATGDGISRTCDGGQNWEHFLRGKSFSAMCFAYGKIFAEAAYDTEIAGTSYPVGEKLYWTDADDEPVQWYELAPWQMCLVPDLSFSAMLSYDLVAVAYDGDTALWSANWYGGLSRSFDWGENWENILWSDTSYNVADSGTIVDTTIYEDRDSILAFVLENGDYHSRLLYAVVADTSAEPPIVYCGTASGIFAIQDTVWWRSRTNQGLTGNWCVALAVQYLTSGKTIVWAASRAVPDESGQIDAICYSTDNGASWDTLATYIMCWNFAFGCDAAFFACEDGFYTADVREEGDSVVIDDFEEIDIVDSESGFRLPLDEMISACVVGDTVWAGSDFGLAFSPDCGENWKILFTPQSPEWEKTYAFPSPFSPFNHGAMFFVFNNPEQGEVELKIFDFALDEVFSQKNFFYAGTGMMFQWNGRDNDGEYPANGIYHYRIALPDGTKLFGKFALLK